MLEPGDTALSVTAPTATATRGTSEHDAVSIEKHGSEFELGSDRVGGAIRAYDLEVDVDCDKLTDVGGCWTGP